MPHKYGSNIMCCLLYAYTGLFGIFVYKIKQIWIRYTAGLMQYYAREFFPFVQMEYLVSIFFVVGLKHIEIRNITKC